MKVAWITLTSGRKEYLEKSRESWYKLIVGDISEEIIIDTSGNKEYSKWLSEKYQNAKIFSLEEELVLGKTWDSGIKKAYEYFYDIAKTIDCDYILHTEDDYVLLSEINIKNVLDILDSDNNICQVHFIRQPWTKDEEDAGSVLRNCEKNGFSLTQKNNDKDYWVEHRSYFTFGPSVYKKDICYIEKDLDSNPELALTYKIFSDLNKKTVTLGKIDDPNLVEHIGVIKG
jgi:hypothetical protein